METRIHEVHDRQIAEILSPGILITGTGEALDIMGNLSYQGIHSMILHAHQLTPEFFDLRTRLAGEILQKYSNYRMRLAIVGDFSAIESKSLRDFIFESNKGRQVNFVASTEAALEALSR